MGKFHLVRPQLIPVLEDVRRSPPFSTNRAKSRTVAPPRVLTETAETSGPGGRRPRLRRPRLFLEGRTFGEPTTRRIRTRLLTVVLRLGSLWSSLRPRMMEKQRLDGPRAHLLLFRLLRSPPKLRVGVPVLWRFSSKRFPLAYFISSHRFVTQMLSSFTAVYFA